MSAGGLEARGGRRRSPLRGGSVAAALILAAGIAGIAGAGRGAAAVAGPFSSDAPAAPFSLLRGPQAARPLVGIARSQVRALWVLFKDKGPSAAACVPDSAGADLGLSERCLRRRMKVRPAGQLIDAADLPVEASYVGAVRALCRRVRVVSRWLNAVSVEASPAQAASIAMLPFVREVRPVAAFARHEPPSRKRVMRFQGAPRTAAELEYGNSYEQLNQIDVIPLHRLGYSGRGVIVGMLDSGFRTSHPVFAAARSRLLAQRDFVNGDDVVSNQPGDPADADSHGTGTWSLLGGFAPGELIGPAYGADFLLAKTEAVQFERPIEEDWWTAGIEWMEARGVDVASSSLGYTDWYTFADMNGRTAVTTKAADRAVSLGVVVVNAAGNERGKAWGHIIAPADGFGVIAAGAVDATGTLASFSSPGPTADGRIKPDVCARGVDDWLAEPPDIYMTGSGTSFSTPLVGGVAALLLEAHPDWTPGQVLDALRSTASQASSPNNDYGWGIVDATAAAAPDVAVLRLVHYGINDGDGNGTLEPGESASLSLTLRNDGTRAAKGVTASLAILSTDVTSPTSTTVLPEIGPRQAAGVPSAFYFTVSAFSARRRVTMVLRIQGGGVVPLETVITLPLLAR